MSRAGDLRVIDRQPAADGPMAVSLRGVSVAFGKFVAVAGVDLDLAEGAFVSLVGPTGCGKSTLLNVITGLRRPQAGTVEVFGTALRELNDHAGYMLQQDVLLPWKTTLDNVALGLIFQGVKVKEARDRARLWLDKVGLSHCGDRYPHELSGGMKKRAAMAQTLILSPRIVLMDEPFGALDVQTRHRMQNELLRLWHEQKVTVLFITHDLEEAITLADRVVVMSAGPAARPAKSFEVPIERPRDVAEVILSDAYRQIYADIWQVLREEVNKSNEHLL
jgi:NitT/TauT family transport system ATP-binding protein